MFVVKFLGKAKNYLTCRIKNLFELLGSRFPPSGKQYKRK